MPSTIFKCKTFNIHVRQHSFTWMSVALCASLQLSIEVFYCLHFSPQRYDWWWSRAHMFLKHTGSKPFLGRCSCEANVFTCWPSRRLPHGKWWRWKPCFAIELLSTCRWTHRTSSGCQTEVPWYLSTETIQLTTDSTPGQAESAWPGVLVWSQTADCS